MRPDVTHPHTGDFFLARQHVDVLRLPQTIVQSGHKQIDRTWVNRVNRIRVNGVWVDGIYRVRFFRIRRSRNKAGQIPVAALLHHVIVVRTGNNTACFLKSTVRITGYFDDLNTFNGLRPGSANVVHRHKRITCGVAEHFQLVGFGGVVIQDGIENQFAAVAGEIFINGKRLPRFAVSMPKVHH